MDCFLCRKHAGETAQPPGGYIYEDEYWLVCHAPAEKSLLGTLIIESRRHFLDFADAEEDELVRYGPLLKNVYRALKSLIGAARVYQVVFVEGAPHFHAWLVPRASEETARGVSLLTRDAACSQAEAEKLADALRSALAIT